jgi:hypothetical protein
LFYTFFTHVISSLAYPNLLENKRVIIIVCIWPFSAATTLDSSEAMTLEPPTSTGPFTA